MHFGKLKFIVKNKEDKILKIRKTEFEIFVIRNFYIGGFVPSRYIVTSDFDHFFNFRNVVP